MTADKAVLNSMVRLARNYRDLPFDVAEKPEWADMCIARTVNALRQNRVDDRLTLLRLRDMTDTQRRALAESRVISRDLLRRPDTAAVLTDRESGVSVMMNEEDHLRIRATRPGLDLAGAAEDCFRVDDALSRQVSFAFDDQLGYLTACPTNTGTGMRASVLMHLPMLTQCKQMGDVGQIVAKVGLTIRGVYGEGSDALGNLYQVSNQVTLGRTEQEIISAVAAVGRQLTDMEHTLRLKMLEEQPDTTEDAIYRAWGILKHARLMPLREFYVHWSNVRMGAALGRLPVDLSVMDNMLVQVQEANLSAWTDTPIDTPADMDRERARRIRGILNA